MANLDYRAGALLCSPAKSYVPVVLVSLELGGSFREVVELRGPRPQESDEAALAIARGVARSLREQGALLVLSAIVNDRPPSGAEDWQLALIEDRN